MSNLYNLSDEELMNADESSFVLDTAVETSTSDEYQEPIPTTDTEVAAEQETESTDTQESAEQTEPTELATESEHSDSANESDSTQADTENEFDYKQFYEEFTKPFKANGKEIQITNLEDAKALMQQGVNYSKKMAQLKPSLGVIKTLEANGLMDESKLAYLIDLEKKNPEAIAKLVKDSGIDLYSFDTDQADNYTPQVQVMQYSYLEETINDLQLSSSEFPRVLNDAINTWDDKSKQLLGENPQILRTITQQAETGLYDKIVAAIDYERMLGRMTGVSFLDAYVAVESKFVNTQTNTTQASQANQAQAFTAPRPNTKSAYNNSNSEQKKKAGTPSNTKNAENTQTFDPLKVSDEELLKYMNQHQYH